jgi:hypothetical protein
MDDPNEFHTEAYSTGSFPYRWSVALRRRIDHQNGVTEMRSLINAKGWARTAEAQERRVQAAMEECRSYVAAITSHETPPTT